MKKIIFIIIISIIVLTSFNSLSAQNASNAQDRVDMENVSLTGYYLSFLYSHSQSLPPEVFVIATERENGQVFVSAFGVELSTIGIAVFWYSDGRWQTRGPKITLIEIKKLKESLGARARGLQEELIAK